jgi:hypothetical protein
MTRKLHKKASIISGIYGNKYTILDYYQGFSLGLYHIIIKHVLNCERNPYYFTSSRFPGNNESCKWLIRLRIGIIGETL